MLKSSNEKETQTDILPPNPQGKRLATPYAKAVMDMLPQSKWFEGEENQPHEPINDVTVHKLSVQQLFVPVAESRHFTREDAAKAFHEDLLSADDRSPHKQLIVMERELAAAKDPNDREAREKALEEYRNKTRKEEDAYAKQIAKKAAQEEAATTRVMTDRCEFRVKEINADDVGRTGRSRRGVGWRYGAPLQDRKRGQIKIPTSVP